MKLVPDWRDAWKWHSTRAIAVLGALPAVWMQIPDDAKSYIPEWALPYIPLALMLAGIIGRVKDQS